MKQTAKIFKNGQSQAVRLPKDFRFVSTEVYIEKHGAAVILTPKQKGWESFAKALTLFTPDFMRKREQPPIQKRDKIFQ